MEVESVIPLELKMGMCWVCIRGWGVGGVWRDGFGVFFPLYVFGFCYLFLVGFLFFCFDSGIVSELRGSLLLVYMVFPYDDSGFISWNLKGVNQSVKLNKVMTHLRQLRGDIFFLQETHLRCSEVTRIRRPWIGDVIHSKFCVACLW